MRVDPLSALYHRTLCFKKISSFG